MAGCAMARPEAARAEARPPAAVGFRGVPRPGTGADAEGDAATVAERGTPGVDALTGVLAFDVRRHGLRFAFALPTERMDAASESPGTCSVENVGAVELIGMSAIVGMSCCSVNPVGESTRAGGVCGAERERSCRDEGGCELGGAGGGSRDGSMILSLLRIDLFDAWCFSSFAGCRRPSSETVAARGWFALRLLDELPCDCARSRTLSEEREALRELEEGAGGMLTNVVVAGVGVGRPSSAGWWEVGSGMGLDIGAVAAGSDWMRLRAPSELLSGESWLDSEGARDGKGSGRGMLDPLTLGEGGMTVTFKPLRPESSLS